MLRLEAPERDDQLLEDDHERLREDKASLRQDLKREREDNARVRRDNERLMQDFRREREDNDRVRAQSERLRQENERLREAARLQKEQCQGASMCHASQAECSTHFCGGPFSSNVTTRSGMLHSLFGAHNHMSSMQGRWRVCKRSWEPCRTACVESWNAIGSICLTSLSILPSPGMATQYLSTWKLLSAAKTTLFAGSAGSPMSLRKPALLNLRFFPVEVPAVRH